jgi:hypothetical protein
MQTLRFEIGTPWQTILLDPPQGTDPAHRITPIDPMQAIQL